MKAECIWQGEYLFENRIREHRFNYDIAPPHGKDRGPSPKEALLSTVLGCTAMDVVAHAGKHHLPLKSLNLRGEAETTTSYPKIFPQIDVVYEIIMEPYLRETQLAELLQGVELSMTKYCGVSAMIAPTSPIFYTVVVNGEIELRSRSAFPTEKRTS